MTNYIGLVHKDPDSDFGVNFPDFPGCVSASCTLENARKMAKEALLGHIACLLKDGEPLPAPSSLEDIMSNPENRDGCPVVIEVG